jgi:FkbM family methyltransferase
MNIESFSQIQQDLEVLKLYKNKKNGFFIEIGASDGITLSNTYLLEKNHQWKGICVEALPFKLVDLTKNRPNSFIVNKAVYKTSGLLLPFKISNTDSLLSGISEHINSHKEVVERNFTEIHVETITLNDILDEHSAPQFIDYLSLDTEGTELEILLSINFKKYTFGLIHVEHNYIEPNRSDIKTHLLENGYIYKGENKFDDCYIHKSLLNNTDIYLEDESKQKFTLVYTIDKNDIEWFQYSLLSLKKFLDSYNIFEIIIYTHDIIYGEVFKILEKLFMKVFFKYRIIGIPYNYNGYIKKMAVKANCYKDIKTEYIVFLDTSVLLKNKFNFNLFIRKDGKIKRIYLKSEDEPNNPVFSIWAKACQDTNLCPKKTHYTIGGIFVFTKKSIEEAAIKFKQLHNCDYEDFCCNRCNHIQVCSEDSFSSTFNKLTTIFSVIEYLSYHCHYFSNDYAFKQKIYDDNSHADDIETYFIQNLSPDINNSKFTETISQIVKTIHNLTLT